MMISACLKSPKGHHTHTHTHTRYYVPLVRGPCPGLNTLANHGLLPRSGKNITQADLVAAMRQGMNHDESLSVLLLRAAVQTNPSKDNATFSLPDLSRQDAFSGDPNPVKQTVFDETLAQWTEDRAVLDDL